MVHHANYVAWFELARTRLCATSGIPYADVEAMGYLMVVTGIEVRYRQPAHYGQRVAVTAWIDRLGSRLTRFAYEVRHGETLLATGDSGHIRVKRASARLRRRQRAHLRVVPRLLTAHPGALEGNQQATGTPKDAGEGIAT